MFVEHKVFIGLRDVAYDNKVTNTAILSYLEDAGGVHSNIVGYGLNDIPKVKSNLGTIASDVKSILTGNKKDQLNLNSIAKDVSSATSTETKLEIGEPINTIGGVIVKTENGDIEVNNTIEARLLRNKKNLRSEVAKTLFN